MFPAETTASASPAATARTALTSDESGLARTASLGFSAMPIAWLGDDERKAAGVQARGAVKRDVDARCCRCESARDDLLRSAVAAQRVDCDAGHCYPGKLKRSTSRPL